MCCAYPKPLCLSVTPAAQPPLCFHYSPTTAEHTLSSSSTKRREESSEKGGIACSPCQISQATSPAWPLLGSKPWVNSELFWVVVIEVGRNSGCNHFLSPVRACTCVRTAAAFARLTHCPLWRLDLLFFLIRHFSRWQKQFLSRAHPGAESPFDV